MTSSYPGSLDSLNNPSAGTAMDAAGYEHDLQHANANDAIEAIEGELGVNPSGSYSTVVARLDAIPPITYAAEAPGSPVTGQVLVLSAGYTFPNVTVTVSNDSANRYGACWFVGTNATGENTSWVNPHTAGRLTVTGSSAWGTSTSNADPLYAVDRSSSDTYLTGSNQWVKIDFGSNRTVKPSGYAFRQRGANGTVGTKTLQWHASNDNTNWDLLNTSDMTAGQATWTDVSASSATSYRYFRWTHTSNSWDGYAYFTFGEFEVFGDTTGGQTYPARTLLVYNGSNWITTL